MAKKKKSSRKEPKDEVVSFEQSLETLRGIVEELEHGNLTLTDSLKKFELGVTSLNRCYDELNQAQRKIEMLVSLDEEGRLVTRPFDSQATVDSRRIESELEGDEPEASGSLF